jgi:HAD superfamily hydrolase (TIGR01459 family)
MLDGVAAVADRYDGWIVDLWGCVHDGIQPFPGVVDLLDRLGAAGAKVMFLSNAPRRADAVAGRLAEMGIGRERYFGIMTSGEEAWRALAARADDFSQGLGDRVYLIGMARDEGMLVGIGAERVFDVADATFVLNCGVDFGETLADYVPLLEAARARDLPMICANPDLVVLVGERRAICAGLLAQHYEQIGGRVRWHGKPLPSVYETCLAAMGITDRGRLVGVGDALRTDVAGAHGFGIDSLFIPGGIHGEALGCAMGALPAADKLAELYEAGPAPPAAAIAAFRW